MALVGGDADHPETLVHTVHHPVAVAVDVRRPTATDPGGILGRVTGTIVLAIFFPVAVGNRYGNPVILPCPLPSPPGLLGNWGREKTNKIMKN